MVPEGFINASKEVIDFSLRNTKVNVIDETQGVITVLYESLIEKIEDINLLEKNNRVGNIEIISRTFFEQYVYLSYILKKHTDTRAKALVYGYRINVSKKYKKALGQMENSGKYNLGESYAQFWDRLNFYSSVVNPKISSYDELITHYEMEYSNLMINNTKPNFKNFKWYNLTGKLNNFRDLVKEVGLQDSEYEVSYSLPSTSLHGTDIVDKIKTPNSRNENLFEGELEKFDNIKAMLALCLKNITEDIVKFYKVNNKEKVKEKLEQMRLSYKLSINK